MKRLPFGQVGTALAVIAAIYTLPDSLFAQGSLTPPGPPAPTMLTLQQIGAKLDQIDTKAAAMDAKLEKRTPVDATHTPGDSNYEFVITQPGSYYLTGNLAVAKANGILINAEDVTLDLNGFEISRTSGTGGNGIEIPNLSHRARIHNGSLKGFAFGIQTLQSAGNFANGCSFQHLSVSVCSSTGILAGDGAVIDSCRASQNSGTSGIEARNSSTFINCTAVFNTVSNGINAGENCTLTNCTASRNNASNGIHAGPGSTLANCSARFNIGGSVTSAGIATDNGCTVTHCSAQSNTTTIPLASTTGIGFRLGAGSTIQGCTATSNVGDGINVTETCVVRENTCDRNGGPTTPPDGAGIHATGTDNRIEANNVTNSDRGIDVDGTGNLIIKNSASGNGTNYDIAAANKVAPIVAAPDSGAISGSTGGAGIGSTDPWANISY
jgi:parallel beta-helix repeat protein